MCCSSIEIYIKSSAFHNNKRKMSEVVDDETSALIAKMLQEDMMANSRAYEDGCF